MAMDSKTSSNANLSCYERYRQIVDIVGLCAKICGANVADPDFRINWTSYVVGTVVINFFLCTAYTFYVGITNDGDITLYLQICCFLGAGLQAFVKFICFLYQGEYFQDMQRFLNNTFMTYGDRSDIYRDALHKSLLNTKRIFKLFMAMNAGAVVSCSIVPIVYYAIYKERILIMQFLVPGLNPNTNTGYVLLVVVHLVSLSLGGFGTFASDMYVLMFVGSIPLFKDILRCKFEDVNILLDREVKPTRTEIHSILVEAVAWHQDYLRFIDTANSVFYIIIFAYVFGCGLGILSTLYCTLAGAWPAAPFFLLYSYLSLYIYCGLGTVVDNSNNECSEIIYTQCRWYELPLREQRYILLILRKSQASSSLTVGDMMPLNVGTGLQLTKVLFSTVMLVLSTQDEVRNAK